jgi:cytochrome b561
MLLLPLSGLVLWAWMRTPLDLFGLLHVAPVLSTRPDDETSLVIGWYLHVWGAWALAGVAALHVGAALWHQWIVRDRRILDRM